MIFGIDNIHPEFRVYKNLQKIQRKINDFALTCLLYLLPFEKRYCFT